MVRKDFGLMNCGDGVLVAYPLFQEEGDGSIPISPLQLEIVEINFDTAMSLNKIWHSKLPDTIKSTFYRCTDSPLCFGALFKNRYYAIAMFGSPIARLLNNKGYLELRRMAISSLAPKNTASRMLSIMKLLIKKKRPEINKLISYQDTSVHKGTIYKAAGWEAIGFRKGAEWKYEGGRHQNKAQATGDKVRWEVCI